MTEISQVNQAIISGIFTNDQLDSIVQAIKFARNQLGRQVKHTLRVGTKVSFVSSKSGQSVNGSVEKINRKFVIVATPAGRWRVPGNMLKVEA